MRAHASARLAGFGSGGGDPHAALASASNSNTVLMGPGR